MISHYYRELDPVEQEAAVERRSQEIRERCVATGCTDDAMVGAVLCGEHFAETSRWVRAGMKGLKLGDILHQRVAALFVESHGAYFDLPGVDVWDITLDARKYQCPYPVVAHPPCNLWVSFAFVNYKRYGGEHNKPGNDGGCFTSALASVREYGGVLEHPAFSHAWSVHGLVPPTGIGWEPRGNGEWVCEVWQSAYGHRARKRTWLFYKGLTAPFELCWERKPAAYQIGYHDQRGKARNKPTVGKKEASRTPVEFRDVLLALARGSRYGVLSA